MKAFESYHPSVLMFYFLSVLITTMFVSNPIIEVSALAGAIMFCVMLKKRGYAAEDIAFYIPMFLLVAITNPLFSHNGITPLFFLNGNPVTLEAFIYGIAIAVTVIGIMLWCKCYSEIMTSDKFLYLFAKVMPKLSLVISMSLRFVPLFKRELHKVSRAQKAMGLYSSESFIDKIKSAGRVFMAMISHCLENSMETSSSMKARGYGIKGRTNFSFFAFHTRDGMLLTVCIALLGTVLYGVSTENTTFYYYPKISEIDISPISLTVYISFGMLSFLPFIIEVKEEILWKYFVSKI